MEYEVKDGCIREEQYMSILDSCNTIWAYFYETNRKVIDGKNYMALSSAIPFGDVIKSMSNLQAVIDSLMHHVTFDTVNDMVEFEKKIPSFYRIHIKNGNIDWHLDKKTFVEDANYFVEKIRGTYFYVFDHDKHDVTLEATH